MTQFTPVDHWARSLIDQRRLAQAEITILRRGETVFSERYGSMDLEGQRPLPEDAVFRIYSMTKPIIAVAVLMLAEQGKLALQDPVAKFIPEFSDAQVSAHTNGKEVRREPAQTPVTLHHLMTHTAGLTYGGDEYPPVSTAYRENGIDFSMAYANLAEMAAKVGRQPLFYQPGTRWIYSVANDILGRVIEVSSGMPLDHFFTNHIFAPLGMDDTGFHVSDAQKDRFVANFCYDAAGKLADCSAGSHERFLEHGTLLSGGGGLVSTSRDYLKFAQMLLGRGSFAGAQILTPQSVDLMTTNHLPGDLPSMGCATHSTMEMTGVGYGYGVSVMIDQNKVRFPCSNGDFGWAGVANTYFWVDPAEQLIVLFMSQLMPASDMPIRVDLRKRVYQSLGRAI